MNFTDPKKMLDEINAKHDKDGDGIKDHQEKPVKGKDADPIVRDSKFKNALGTIRETLAGENQIGKSLGVFKDAIKYLIPWGSVADKATDLIGDQLKTKEDSKTMIRLKNPKTTILGVLLIVAGILKFFFGVDSENWDFAHIAESATVFLTGSGLILSGDGSKAPSD